MTVRWCHFPEAFKILTVSLSLLCHTEKTNSSKKPPTSAKWKQVGSAVLAVFATSPPSLLGSCNALQGVTQERVAIAGSQAH